MTDATPTSKATDALLSLALESWKFRKLFNRVLQKLEADTAQRFDNQQRFFTRKIDEALQQVGIKFVSLENQPYDVGDAVSPINIGDFESDDRLVVDQMVEPIVMGEAGLLRSGVCTLRKAG